MNIEPNREEFIFGNDFAHESAKDLVLHNDMLRPWPLPQFIDKVIEPVYPWALYS